MADNATTFCLRHRTLGAHVRARLFIVKGGTSALSGELVFTLEEWDQFEDALFEHGGPALKFIDEASES